MFRLDLAQALHKMFALHLELYAAGTESHGYDADAVADPSICDLGKWISVNEGEMQVLSHFGGLKAAHRHFHLTAGKLAGRSTHAGGTEALGQLADALHAAASSLTQSLAAVADECRSHPEFRSWDVVSQLGSVANGFRFDESMHIGVPVIDQQHELIAATASHLLGYPTERLTSEAVNVLLVQLQKLLIQHFATEEMFMRSTRMPASLIKAHTAEHTRIIGLLGQLQLDTLMRFDRVVSDIIKDIYAIVVEHVLGFDLQLVQYLR